MNQTTKFEYITRTLQTIASVILAGTGIVGLWLVLAELDQFKQQNETLERTLRQSFRPLGVAKYSWAKQDMIVLSYPALENKEKDKISFTVTLILKNKGRGILSYIGSISYLTQKEIDFRTKFLNSEIKDVHFDKMYTYTRKTTLLPEDTIDTYASWENVPFAKTYYLYVLYLYEDQDGNLFDTQHLDVLPFQEPIPTDKGLQAKLDTTYAYPPYTKEIYNTYSIEERSKLCSVLKGLKHYLSDYICNK